MKIIELLQSNDLESRNLGIELLKTHQDYEFLKRLTGVGYNPSRGITIERWIKLLGYPVKMSNRMICDEIRRILKYNGIDI